MRSVFKQIVASAVVLAVGFGLWLAFSPGSTVVLARFGLVAEQGQAQTGQAPAGRPKDGNKGGGQGAGQGGGGRGPRVATVVVTPAGTAILNDKVSAMGTAAARSSVSVLPKSAGQLTQVLIGSGALVAAGDVIATLDSSAEQLALDKAKLAYDDAKRTLARNDALVKSNQVAETQSQAVQFAASVAELNLRVAKQDLADRNITAPIAGVVGILDVSVGNGVTSQTVIARIEDSSVLKVDFWLPEQLSGKIAVGDNVEMVAVAHPQDVLSAKVSAVDNQVDAASGTFRIQADLSNAERDLKPGTALAVSLKFKGDSFVAVDPLAILWGSTGAYVWRVVDGKAQKSLVRIVQRNTEAVLIAGDVSVGDVVITEGLDGLKDGAEVKIFGAAEPEKADASTDQSTAGHVAGDKPPERGKQAKPGRKPAATAGN